MSLLFETEESLEGAAGAAARAWQAAGIAPLIVGLRGELGVGKTSFVRAVLRALGHGGRVPSPTYTLLEHYSAGGLSLVHLDLYRLKEPAELENLGLRDWLALPRVWVMVEWPERGGPGLEAALDLELRLEIVSADCRRLRPLAIGDRGRRALEAWLGKDFK